MRNTNRCFAVKIEVLKYSVDHLKIKIPIIEILEFQINMQRKKMFK